MTPAEKKELKSKGKSLKAFLALGKSGLSDNTIENIVKYLKANKLGKIKLTKDFIDSQELSKKGLALKIAEATNSQIIELVGFVLVLYKR